MHKLTFLRKIIQHDLWLIPEPQAAQEQARAFQTEWKSKREARAST